MVITNIFKHKMKSFFAALISFLIILFLFVYLGGLIGNKDELDNLSYTLPVEAEIVNANGSRNNDLNISPGKVQKLERTNMIKDVVKITNHYVDESLTEYNEGELAGQHFETKLFTSNTFDGFTYIEKESIELSEGYTADFLESKEAICILEKNHMTQNNLKVGDEYSVNLYRRKYDDYLIMYEMNYVNKCTMKIIGSFQIDSDMARGVTTPIAVAPIAYIRQVYKETDAPYHINSMSFFLNDALEINKFKKEIEEIGFVPRNPQGGYDIVGTSVVTYDESFIKTEKQLRENINLMEIFAPLVFLVVAFIGFLASYLLMQSRKNEFAIMRSLGKSKKGVFAAAFLESLLLSVMGGIIGSVAGFYILDISIFTILLILSIFIVLYLMGTIVALILIGRFSVMEILAKADE